MPTSKISSLFVETKDGIVSATFKVEKQGNSKSVQTQRLERANENIKQLKKEILVTHFSITDYNKYILNLVRDYRVKAINLSLDKKSLLATTVYGKFIFQMSESEKEAKDLIFKRNKTYKPSGHEMMFVTDRLMTITSPEFRICWITVLSDILRVMVESKSIYSNYKKTILIVNRHVTLNKKDIGPFYLYGTVLAIRTSAVFV